MDESRREKIFKMSAELVADTPVVFKRYLYSETVCKQENSRAFAF